MSKLEIFWSESAKLDLKEIYLYKEFKIGRFEVKF